MLRNAPPAVRHGFWASVVLTVLYLAAAAINPVAGLAAALIFAAVALGIRHQRAWAPIAGICFMAVPVVAGALRQRNLKMLGIALLLEGAFVILLGRAAAALWSRREGRALWPWAPAAVIVSVFWLSFYPFQVAAGSMEQTLHIGDQILVEATSWKLGRTPELGDVVVIRYPLDRKQLFIKRVVGGPGDRLRIHDKKLYRNGEVVDEPYAVHAAAGTEQYRDNFPAQPTVHVPAEAEEMLRYHVENGELLIPDGRYFVLGDNRDNSLDSRYWGLISAHDIVGSPVVIYGPARLPKLVR